MTPGSHANRPARKEPMNARPAKLKAILPPALLLLAVFGATLVLFLELQPFILFDTDDWLYISTQRPMVFIPGYWNPTRVFPEVFMPLCGNIAAYLVMPFTGDYVEALKIVFALVYSVFITVYVGLFFRLVRKRFAGTALAVLAAALFFLLHFIVLTGGAHLFQSSSPTNLFYYSLSTLLCCALVLFLMTDDVLDGFFANRHLVKKGVFFALLYLALCSNLYASIVVGAYVGIDLLLRFIKTLRERGSIRSFFARNIPKCLVLAFWCIVQVLEATGKRALSLSEPVSLSDGIAGTAGRFLSLAYDPLFFGLSAVVLVAFFVTLLRNRKDMIRDPRMRIIGAAALAAILVLVYLILLCARTRASYIQRPDVLVSFYFYAIAVVVLCLVVVANRYPRAMIVLPVCVLFLLFYVRPAPDAESALRAEMTHDLIAQIQEGVDAGEEVVDLHVPVYGSEANWPLSPSNARAFPRSLYQHGLIERLVTVQVITDPAMNEKYGIPLP